MSLLNRPFFHDDGKAIELLERLLWPDGPRCPYCGGLSRVFRVKSELPRLGRWRCADCIREFRVTVNSLFYNHNLELSKGLQAIYLLSASPWAISTGELAAILEINPRSAYIWRRRIREAMLSSRSLMPATNVADFDGREIDGASQIEKFREAARRFSCDPNETRWRERLRRIAAEEPTYPRKPQTSLAPRRWPPVKPAPWRPEKIDESQSAALCSHPCFHNDRKAIDLLERLLWPDGPLCPYCGSSRRIVSHESVLRPGGWLCRACGREFRVTVGTFFHQAAPPISKRLQCIYLLSTSPSKIGALELQAILEVSYESAYTWRRRTIEAMRQCGLSEPSNRNTMIDGRDIAGPAQIRKFRKAALRFACDPAPYSWREKLRRIAAVRPSYFSKKSRSKS